MKKKGMQASKGLGERIRKIRKSKGLSQKDFAEVMGYSDCYLSEIERGHKKPNIVFVEKLLTIHKVNLHYLITGVGEALVPEEEIPYEKREKKPGFIKTIPDLNYYLKHSYLFRDAVMAFAAKYHLENEAIIDKTIE